jgi:XTP/dITP diphosphohydrolase
MDIILATRNRNKVDEIRKILNVMGSDFRIYTPDDFPASKDVEEDGETFEANAVKKAEYFFNYTGKTSIADDSGLEVKALNGAPGIFSARYAGEPANTEANTLKILEDMKSVPYEKRKARFVCCIAVASTNGVKTFTGLVNGRIGTEKKGSKGFGYDPVFYPYGYKVTFAEMGDEEKNSISHRAIALSKLQKYLLGNG